MRIYGAGSVNVSVNGLSHMGSPQEKKQSGKGTMLTGQRLTGVHGIGILCT